MALIFLAQFIKIISHYKNIGYNMNVFQQTACLVVNPITIGYFVFFFNCTPLGLKLKLKDLSIDPVALTVVRSTRIYLLDFFCSSIQFYVLFSPYLCFITFLYLDLYVFGDDA